MTLNPSSFYNYILFLCLFLLTFAGNADVFGIDFFSAMVALVSAYFVTFYQKINLQGFNSKHSRLSWAIFLFFFAVLIFVFFKSTVLQIPYINYFIWPIKVVFLFVFLVVIRDNWKEASPKAFFVYTAMGSIAFVTGMLLFGDSEDGRVTFIFGPNVLYRVLIFFILTLIVVLTLFKIKGRLKVIYSLVLLLILFYLLSLVGSRGGVIILVAVLSLTFLIKYFFNVRNFLLLLIIAPMLFLSLLDLFESSRVFSFEGIGQNIRIVFFMEFLNNISLIPVFGYSWQDFLKYAVYGFSYPHNSFVELVYYYGVLGWLMVFFVSYVAILAIRFFVKRTINSRNLIEYIYILLFLIVLFSSFASGDLTDNFTIISFALYGFFNWQISTPK